MRKSIPLHNHFIKSLGFILLFAFISFGTIGGCSNDNGGGNGDQALTENDFAEDTNLRANPAAGVIVMFLEHPDSETPPNDTAEVGRDTIPVRYDKAFEHSFCWEDDVDDASHFMALEDEQGTEILRVDANDQCASAIIQPGNYFMHLHHDGKMELSHPIFLIPQENEELTSTNDQTMAGQFFAKVSNMLESNLLERLDLGFTQSTNAQGVADNIETLLRTRACSGCNLTAANLSNASLNGVRLDEAYLTLAFFNGSDLSCIDPNIGGTNCTRFDNAVAAAADFGCVDPNDEATCVDLSNAVFSETDLKNADFNGATLISTFFNGSNMTGANLEGAWLKSASFGFANLTDANLIGVGLEFTEFGSATWCDGTCVCGSNSFNTCEGCAPIETCTGS